MNTKAKGTERQHAYSSAAEGGAGQTLDAERDNDQTVAQEFEADAQLRRILDEVQNTRKVGNAALQELESRLNAMGRPDPIPFSDEMSFQPESQPQAQTPPQPRAQRRQDRRGVARGTSMLQGSMSEMTRYDEGMSLTERLRELSTYLHASLAERAAARASVEPKSSRPATETRQPRPKVQAQPQPNFYAEPQVQPQPPQQQPHHQPKLTPTAPVLDRMWFEERFTQLRHSINDIAEQVPTKRLDALEAQFHKLMERLDARENEHGGMGAVEAGLKKLAAYLEDSKQWSKQHDRRQRVVEERLDQLSGLVAQSHAAISATAKGLEIVARNSGPQLARQTAELVAARVEEKIAQHSPGAQLDNLSRELANLTTQQRQYARSTDQRLKELQIFLENTETTDRQAPAIQAELEARAAVQPQIQPAAPRPERKPAQAPVSGEAHSAAARQQQIDEGDDYDRDLIAAAQRAARLAEGPRRDVPAHGEPVRYQIPYGEFLPDEERRNSHLGLIVAAVILLLASAAMLYLNLREKDVFGWMPGMSAPANSVQDKGGRTSDATPTQAPQPSAQVQPDNTTAAIRKLPVASAAVVDETVSKTAAGAEKNKSQPGSLTSTETITPVVSARTQVTVAAVPVDKSSVREAAVKGEPHAQFTVGQNLLSGQGSDTEPQLDTRERLSMAARWFRRAAEKGHPASQYRLATLFELGQGAPKDFLMAEAWYRRAAEAGHVKAMHNLAVLAVGARGGSANYLTAAKWFAKAADHGLSDSQYNLAILYERGMGVEPNLVKAYQWYAIAARFGDTKAAQKRDALARKITPQEVTATDALVAAWTPQSRDPKVNGALAELPAKQEPETKPEQAPRPVPAPARAVVKPEAPRVQTMKMSWNTEVQTQSPVVLEAQRFLLQLGYKIGRPDGMLGPRTLTAAREFEISQGLPPTGRVDETLVARLAFVQK